MQLIARPFFRPAAPADDPGNQGSGLGGRPANLIGRPAPPAATGKTSAPGAWPGRFLRGRPHAGQAALRIEGGEGRERGREGKGGW